MYNLTGYSNFIYKTRDMNTALNPNCGGGLAILSTITLNMKYWRRSPCSSLVFMRAYGYKSPLIQKKCKIIGNIHRPNSAPQANLSLAIVTHNSIISKIKAHKKY